MVFFSFIDTAFSCILYGVVATAIIMAILYAILSYISKNIVHTIPFYLTGIILAILLTIQSTLLIGAIQAKESIEAIHVYLNQSLEDANGYVGAQESQRIFDNVVEEFPIIGLFIGYTDYSGHSFSELPDVMCDSINEFFVSFIWHRVFWIIGFVFLGCLIPMLYDNRRDNSARNVKKNTARHSHKNYDDF